MEGVNVVVVASGPAGPLRLVGFGAVAGACWWWSARTRLPGRWRSCYAGLRPNTFRTYSRLPGLGSVRAAGRTVADERAVIGWSVLNDSAIAKLSSRI